MKAISQEVPTMEAAANVVNDWPANNPDKILLDIKIVTHELKLYVLSIYEQIEI